MIRSKLPKVAMAMFLALTFFLSSVVGPAPVAYAQDDVPPTREVPAPPEDGGDVEGQIVGGVNADPGEWPWQVFLERNYLFDGVYYQDEYFYEDQFCGGTLIDPYWVVTAAHCVTNNKGKVISTASFRVVAGGHEFDNTTYVCGSSLCFNGNDPDYYQARTVAKIIKHPKYDPATYNNDIALLKLSSPVSLGGAGFGETDIIPLATSGMGSFSGSTAWVTGWGANSSGQNYYTRKNILQEVNVPVISNTTCNNKYGGGITSNMLCAGYLTTGGKDACQGDSGGPLVIDSGGGNWVLAGVVSFGIGCANKKYPGVYTRVSKYTSWINGHLAAPEVTSITLLDPQTTKAASVRYKVTFSKSVSGVDLADFYLDGTASTGATVSSVTGTGNVRTVTVATGPDNGILRLNVGDNDTILDSNFTPLGGVGAGNGNFTFGLAYVVAKNTSINVYYSSGSTYDGWVLESTETSKKGGTINSAATTLRVGDDAKNKQYRSILDFDTTVNPVDPAALIYKITLRIKRQGTTGTNPFTALGAINVDVAKPFGSSYDLQKGDFQASAQKKNITKFTSKNSSGWHSATIGSSNWVWVNFNGYTQFRLQFATDDNNDFLANYISFYSGDSLTNAPELIIEYYYLP